jgi:hypothetical protein
MIRITDIPHMPVIPLHDVSVKSVVAVVKKISYCYMLACKLLACPSKLMQSNLPWSSPLCQPLSISVFFGSKVRGHVFSDGPYCTTRIYFTCRSVSLGYEKIHPHKHFCALSLQLCMSMSDACVAVTLSMVQSLPQVYSHAIHIPWLVTVCKF